MKLEELFANIYKQALIHIFILKINENTTRLFNIFTTWTW